MTITSLQNPQVKRLVRLRQRRDRDAEGVILVEGARELARALQAGVQATELYLCPDLFSDEARELERQLKGAAPLTLLSRTAFEKASGRENPDGVLGVLLRPRPQLPQPGEQAVVVVLHGLEKPGNIGAILRSADSVGAAAVLVLGHGADPYSPNVIRASQGSLWSMPTLPLSVPEAFGWLAANGFKLVACTPDAPQDYWHTDLGGKVALLFGTEHEGLPAEWRLEQGPGAAAVGIPMIGQADSLNVATAAALVLYETLRQRRLPTKEGAL